MKTRDLALATGILGLVFTWFFCFRSTMVPQRAAQEAAVSAEPAPSAPSSAATGPALAHVELTLREDGSITIEGSVKDAAGKTNLVDAVRNAYAPKRLTDALSIDPKLGAVGRITLMGRVASESAKARAAQNVARMLAGVAIDNRIEVGTVNASAPAATQQRKLREALAESSVEFETGSARLTAKGKALLDELAATIQEDPDTHIEVQGHTDARGAAEKNMRLSQARAIATLEYLVMKGVAAKRLSARGYGQDHPIADNDTEEGRRQNRRIDFLVEEGN
jgi:OmpA-OmpF porin, OOP family